MASKHLNEVGCLKRQSFKSEVARRIREMLAKEIEAYLTAAEIEKNADKWAKHIYTAGQLDKLHQELTGRFISAWFETLIGWKIGTLEYRKGGR